MSRKLFAVYLGGRAPKCNLELHDVAFAIGDTIESTYEQLLDQWFGQPERLHLDSWMEVRVVDGFKITVTDRKPDNPLKLYFLNLGAYLEGQFTELHATTLVAAADKPEAKAKAKDALLKTMPGAFETHTDDLFGVDDCLEVGKVGGYYISLEATGEREVLKPVNGYHIIPKPVVADYVARKKAARFI